MREHAIPQDVTGYRFHIVGNMTLKQFGIVAAGFITAFIFNGLNMPMPIKWALMIASGALGLIVAFVPFEERPLDHWIITFIKSMYRPTKFYWQRKALIPSFFNYTCSKNIKEPDDELDLSHIRKKRFQDYVQTIKTSSDDQEESSPWDQRQNERISVIINEFSTSKVKLSNVKRKKEKPLLKVRVRSLLKDSSDASIITTRLPLPTHKQQVAVTLSTRNNQQLQKTVTKKGSADTTWSLNKVKLEKKPDSLQLDEVFPIKSDAAQFGRILSTEKNNSTNKKKQKKTHIYQRNNQIKTIDQASIKLTKALKKKPSDPQTHQVPHQVQVYAQNKPSVSKKVSGQTIATSSDLPFPSPPKIPNLIVGMVLTPQNNMIGDAYVEILSSDGEILRSTKTNNIGQFYISDPLKKGRYIINVQKKGFNFDTYEIKTANKIIKPLKISSL